MQHATNLVKTEDQRSAPQSTQTQDERLIAWVDALFAKLKAIFGQKWNDQFAGLTDLSGAKAEWAEGLRGLSGEQVKRAIGHCRDNLDWPPSIAAFRKAAMTSPHGTPAYRRNEDALALPRTTYENRKANGLRQLESLKEKLAASDEPEPQAEKRTVYGDDYFATKNGYRVYKPGQEKLKSYIGRED